MLYACARPLLFTLDAERAHELTLGLLARAPSLGAALAAAPVEDPVTLGGLRLRNRVGLAAGLDKNGHCIDAWDRMGFGFVEVGTVTPRPQPGNPRPRMFRDPGSGALINRLGFNNLGVDHLVERIRGRHLQACLGINIGKNADTPIERAADDYVRCLDKIYAHAGYVTVNISSPNTRNLRDLQQNAQLTGLLAAIQDRRLRLREASGRQVPIFVKIAPDMDDEQLAAVARIVVEQGMDGLIATNTTLSREGLVDQRLVAEAGGMSGAPLRARSNTVMQQLRQLVGPAFPLIGVGGISSGSDALERRTAGADVIQIYSGLIYRGPALVAECARALAG